MSCSTSWRSSANSAWVQGSSPLRTGKVRVFAEARRRRDVDPPDPSGAGAVGGCAASAFALDLALGFVARLVVLRVVDCCETAFSSVPFLPARLLPARLLPARLLPGRSASASVPVVGGFAVDELARVAGFSAAGFEVFLADDFDVFTVGGFADAFGWAACFVARGDVPAGAVAVEARLRSVADPLTSARTAEVELDRAGRATALVLPGPRITRTISASTPLAADTGFLPLLAAMVVALLLRSVRIRRG